MTFVYHLMPRHLIGDTLYPLNQLRERLPAVYVQHVSKYQGREGVLSRQIPHLNCLWNDVLFFASIHPRTFQIALSELGILWQMHQWLEIDTEICGFNETNTVIYEPDMSREKGDFTLTPDRVTPFTSERSLPEAIPSSTLSYYHEAMQRNEHIMLWRGVTHILHRGTISLTKGRRVEV